MFTLTRFLYIKDEVQLALLLSILEKKDESVYWAYEIYYSSNKSNEIFDLLWKIYYDFFAILNPTFEMYFMTKQMKWTRDNGTRDNGTNTRDSETNTRDSETRDIDVIISMLVQDLLIRDSSTDAFMLRQLILIPTFYNKNKNKDKDKDKNVLDLTNIIQTKNYRLLANYILIESELKDMDEIYETVLDMLDPIRKKQLIKQLYKMQNYLSDTLDKQFILLVKIISLMIEKEKINKKTKSFYVQVKPQEIACYHLNNFVHNINPYQVLKNACKFPINNYAHFSLFNFQRNNLTHNQLKEEYHNNWLFYASFSPIWSKRLHYYGANVNLINKKVEFQKEDLEEEFYNNYNYEPDEQSLEVKNKTIPESEFININNNLFTFIQNTNENLIDLNDTELEFFKNKKITY